MELIKPAVGQRLKQVAGTPWTHPICVGTILRIVSRSDYIDNENRDNWYDTSTEIYMVIEEPSADAGVGRCLDPDMGFFWREFCCERHFA